ncbi:cobalamin-dependent protein [bacterium]|nr:cobalamin-dependent protein [bacterium]
MKVLLIFPPTTVYESDPTVPAAALPLGLAYIAAYLEKHDYGVRILDTVTLGSSQREDGKVRYGLSEKEILNYLSNYCPDVVGITVMYTAYARDAHDVARIVKRYNSRVPVIFGGAHASIWPELVLEDRNVDLVVIGEGESTFLELVERLEKGEDVSCVLGTAVRAENEIIRNKLRPYIKDLDSIPFPARHLLPMERYIDYSARVGVAIMRRPFAVMISSRGCPERCTFCCIHSVWGRGWRARSAKNVVDEIEHLVKKYEIREVGFFDDSMGTSIKRLNEICDEIIRRRLNIRWIAPNGIAHWTLNREILKKMKRSGCYRLTFGIESGNVETRKFIRKRASLEQARGIIQYANRIGMWTVSTYILGFPYERLDSIKDTMKFAIDSDNDLAIFYLLRPHPGTEVYEIFKKEELLNLDYFLNPLGSVTSNDSTKIGGVLAGRGAQTKHFSPEELRDLLSKAYKSFFRARARSFLNPLRILRKIHSFEDFIYILRLGLVAVKSLLRLIKSRHFSSQMFRRALKKEKCLEKSGQSL